MEINAAVFRKVHEPLTIEQVEIDEPRGRRCTSSGVRRGIAGIGRKTPKGRPQCDHRV